MLKKLAVLFAVLALVVAACGDSGDGEETTTTVAEGGGGLLRLHTEENLRRGHNASVRGAAVAFG